MEWIKIVIFMTCVLAPFDSLYWGAKCMLRGTPGNIFAGIGHFISCPLLIFVAYKAWGILGL